MAKPNDNEVTIPLDEKHVAGLGMVRTRIRAIQEGDTIEIHEETSGGDRWNPTSRIDIPARKINLVIDGLLQFWRGE